MLSHSKLKDDGCFVFYRFGHLINVSIIFNHDKRDLLVRSASAQGSLEGFPYKNMGIKVGALEITETNGRR